MIRFKSDDIYVLILMKKKFSHLLELASPLLPPPTMPPYHTIFLTLFPNPPISAFFSLLVYVVNLSLTQIQLFDE